MVSVMKAGLVLFVLLSLLTAVQAYDSTDPVVVLLFMFFGLIVGIVILQLLSHFGESIPYTVVVFITGLVFSLAHKGNSGTTLHFSHPLCLTVTYSILSIIHSQDCSETQYLTG